jgi:hypothetical protein
MKKCPPKAVNNLCFSANLRQGNPSSGCNTLEFPVFFLQRNQNFLLFILILGLNCRFEKWQGESKTNC